MQNEQPNNAAAMDMAKIEAGVRKRLLVWLACTKRSLRA